MGFEVSQFCDPEGYISIDALLEELHITRKELVIAIGLSQHATFRKDRLHSAATQQRLRQILEILRRIEPWAGSMSAAWSWYRTYPIAAFGNLTAEELLTRNRAEDVRSYLVHVAEGGYA